MFVSKCVGESVSVNVYECQCVQVYMYVCMGGGGC